MTQEDNGNNVEPVEIPKKRVRVEDLPEEVREALMRPLSENDFYYLLSRYPYLEISKVDAEAPSKDIEPRLIHARSGWVIQDYGDYMRTSAGVAAYGPRLEGESEGGEGGDGGNGTIVWQGVLMASELCEVARKKGWPATRVVSGTYTLQRAFWIMAELANYAIEGFAATDEDRVVLHWARTLGITKPPPRPTFTPG